VTEIITRKWKDGKVVSETRKQFDWEPNAADLDAVTVVCKCRNEFEMPRDALFGLPNMYCGQCGTAGKMRVKQ